MDLKASSLMSFVPWVVMALGSTTAGLLADGLVRREALGRSRLLISFCRGCLVVGGWLGSTRQSAGQRLSLGAAPAGNLFAHRLNALSAGSAAGAACANANPSMVRFL